MREYLVVLSVLVCIFLSSLFVALIMHTKQGRTEEEQDKINATQHKWEILLVTIMGLALAGALGVFLKASIDYIRHID